MKTWQSQLVLENYKLVIDLICEPLKCGKPKNLSQLKKVAFGEDDENKEDSEKQAGEPGLESC